MVWQLAELWKQELLDLYVYGKPFVFGVSLTLVAWLGFNWAMILERIMSRRKQKQLHKQEMAEVADGVSYLLETMVEAKKIRPTTKKRIMRDMRKIGFKDLGYEPSFGSPKNALTWVDPRPSINLLKVQIAERLPKGVFAKFLQRRPETRQKKVQGVFAFMNEVRSAR
jgi:hypothetical protein